MNKICTKCGFELNIDMFTKLKRNKDGLSHQCKKCDKEYRIKNKDVIKGYKEKCKESIKEYRVKNKEATSIYKKQYSIDNRQKISKRMKIYRQVKKKELAIYAKEYRDNHKEELVETARKWREKNKSNIAINSKKYQKENKIKLNIVYQKRRSRKKQLPATLTETQWINIKQHFNDSCAYCGKKIVLEQEHVIPLSKGGEYTNNNIIPACKSCNCSKGNKTYEEWYSKYKYYSKKREKILLDYLGYDKGNQQLKII